MFKYIVFIFVFFITSCKVGNKYPATPIIDNAQVIEQLDLSTADEPISETWYTIFNDKDLNTLLTIALKDNYSIAQAVERLHQSRYNYMIQSKNYYPQLDISAKYDYNKTRNKKMLQSNTNFFQTGFDSSWEINLWGKGDYVSEQYKELINQAQYSLANIKVSIMSEIITNYISLRETQEKLRITKKNLSFQKETLQTISDKFKSGIKDSLSLNQAQYTVENTKASIPPLEAQIESKINSLSILLGKTPKTLPINLNKYTKNIVSSPFKYSVSNLYKLPFNVIHTRPDILVAEAKVKEQNAIINEAITNLYPSLNLSAVFGYISTSGTTLFEPNSQNYGYSPVINAPIWNWQQLKNNIELQKHIHKEYLSAYNEAVLTAVSELKTAIFSVEEEYKHNQFLQSAQTKMQNILDLTKKKYQNGLVDFTDVATAEQNLLQAQLNFSESNAQILLYLVSFYKSTGGGFNFQSCK